ncbi:MAG: Eco57I restriction-modification methylase domain-containing protein [Acidobacteriota bacterium]|nr:Eco57I restriction-modification methylase domain-containing protein [Acidobacteriota bacterium]
MKLQARYEQRISLAERKRKGQYFTPREVCSFMASLFSEPKSDTYRFLDPGAGIGSLTAALCERLSQSRRRLRIEAHIFENHSEMLPYLRQTVSFCRNELEQVGHWVTVVIHDEDFILDAAAGTQGCRGLFNPGLRLEALDAVIMNPPYFKLRKSSQYARVMDAVVHGQPNIYALFLAASAEMLRPDGEMVAITPRSFCNGLYFREFRRWFFDRMALERIHLFESRTDTFRDVLQESIITLSRRLGKSSSHIAISTSYGRDIGESMRARKLPASFVVDTSTREYVIRVPVRDEDLSLLESVESWVNRFSDLGLGVSTGPVVTFRAREFLLHDLNRADFTPLLSTINVKPFETIWPAPRKKHPTGFKVCAASMRLLLPAQNYVLLRRFSAKEERRRLTASCLLNASRQSPYVALENHLNYVYHTRRPLSVDETYGLAALFNSALLDRYFRTISGSTQVNATELRNMPFPSLETIAAIGRKVQGLPALRSEVVERVVLDCVCINGTLGDHLIEAASE